MGFVSGVGEHPIEVGRRGGIFGLKADGEDDAGAFDEAFKELVEGDGFALVTEVGEGVDEATTEEGAVFAREGIGHGGADGFREVFREGEAGVGEVASEGEGVGGQAEREEEAGEAQDDGFHGYTTI